MLRLITAREQLELCSPWRVAGAPMLESINPTGSLFVNYDPGSRTGPLSSSLTTLDRAMGVHPDHPVTIYRGAPHSQKSIAPGDFITTDSQLAHDYAGTGRVLQMTVPSSHIATDPDEWEGGEHIYRPPSAKKAMKSIQPNMKVPRQVNKFNQRAEEARAQGNTALADYLDFLREKMLQGVKEGQPQPFSQWFPLAEEEFDL